MTDSGVPAIQTCSRRPDRPILPVHAVRSIYVTWPPEATCGTCGLRPATGEGYVGPVEGDQVSFPTEGLWFTCERCARTAMGLDPVDPSAHHCLRACTEAYHVELVDRPTGELEQLTPLERLTLLAPAYDARGWAVVGVDRPSLGMDVPPIEGTWWAVWIRPARPR